MSYKQNILIFFNKISSKILDLISLPYWNLRRSYWRAKHKIRKTKQFIINKYLALKSAGHLFLIRAYWKGYSLFMNNYGKIKGSTIRAYWNIYGFIKRINYSYFHILIVKIFRK